MASIWEIKETTLLQYDSKVALEGGAGVVELNEGDRPPGPTNSPRAL
jgi:hypothetical protein